MKKKIIEESFLGNLLTDLYNSGLEHKVKIVSFELFTPVEMNLEGEFTHWLIVSIRVSNQEENATRSVGFMTNMEMECLTDTPSFIVDNPFEIVVELCKVSFDIADLKLALSYLM